MAIETPVDVLRRLREETRQRRVARAEVPAQAFRKARTGKEKATAFGGQIGAALAQAFATEQDLEQDPKVIQARQRKQWLDVAPDDVEGLKRNISLANKAEDYEVARFLTDQYVQAERIRLAKDTLEAREEKIDKPKKWKWKHWQTDTRNILRGQASELDWVKDINDDDEEEKVTGSIVARAESLWNTWREKGLDISPERAYSIASTTASKHFQKSMFGDTFDFEGFQTDFSQTMGLGDDKFLSTKEEDKKPKFTPPKAGEVRDGWRFLGGDWKDQSRWRKVDTK